MKTYERICSSCHGNGSVKINKEIDIKVPAGVDTGTRLKLSGKGSGGVNGGANGDLYIEFSVSEHEYFVRDENDIYVIDFGTNSAESVDFPVYAKKLGEAIQNEEIDLGIAICGTGIGMSIVLNKMKGVYCAKVSNESEAILCRSHNNANVIAMSEEIDHEVMKKIVNNFIETPFSNVSKYIRRNNMIKEIENE